VIKRSWIQLVVDQNTIKWLLLGRVTANRQLNHLSI